MLHQALQTNERLQETVKRQSEELVTLKCSETDLLSKVSELGEFQKYARVEIQQKN
jgi:hypothetical protein